MSAGAPAKLTDDIMNTQLVLTIIGDDRPGIVQLLSEVLAEHGGNWAESNMLSLAGKFAGILLASVPEERVTECREAFAALEKKGLQIVTQVSGEGPGDSAMREVTLELVGNDRPGIVQDISRILGAHSINVEELETGVESASMAGGNLFRARARLKVPEQVSLGAVREELEALANELMVEIALEP